MARASGLLRLIVETEPFLGEPDVDEGLVTRFDVRVVAGERAERVVVGNARGSLALVAFARGASAAASFSGRGAHLTRNDGRGVGDEKT
jgi:hypothetical protein